eukprot:m.60033 g.60033  ORF g.60033 m.60033 type:complete len:97 (-) comp7255_c0_seq3:850-1140(-)
MAVASVGIMAALCAGMFAVTVFQLVLRAISGHRLRSHFTACMVMCSVWALLRAAMMSLYTRHDTATSVSTVRHPLKQQQLDKFLLSDCLFLAGSRC